MWTSVTRLTGPSVYWSWATPVVSSNSERTDKHNVSRRACFIRYSLLLYAAESASFWLQSKARKSAPTLGGGFIGPAQHESWNNHGRRWRFLPLRFYNRGLHVPAHVALQTRLQREILPAYRRTYFPRRQISADS